MSTVLQLVAPATNDQQQQGQSMLAALFAAVEASRQSSKVAEAMVQLKEAKEREGQ